MASIAAADLDDCIQNHFLPAKIVLNHPEGQTVFAEYKMWLCRGISARSTLPARPHGMERADDETQFILKQRMKLQLLLLFEFQCYRQIDPILQ